MGRSPGDGPPKGPDDALPGVLDLAKSGRSATWGNQATLDDHFKRLGHDFGSRSHEKTLHSARLWPAPGGDGAHLVFADGSVAPTGIPLTSPSVPISTNTPLLLP